MGRINSSSQNSDCPSNCSGWLEFIRSVYVCKRLASAIDRYTSKEVVEVIDTALLRTDGADIFRGTSSAYDNYEVSSDALDQVLDLVIERTETYDELSVPESLIYEKLNQLLYPTPFRKGTFLQSVWYGQLSRASISAKVCEIILLDSLSTENCLSVLGVGIGCGCEDLSRYCYQYCLEHFQDAVERDTVGLVSLPLEVLRSIIQEDRLRVEDEEKVLSAISMWVEHALPERLPYFVDLFAKGIRFSEIDYSQLANIVDTYDLVSSNHAAVELAAHELIQKTMGTSRDNALGLGTICRPRAHREQLFPTDNSSMLSNFILPNTKSMEGDKENVSLNSHMVGNIWDIHVLQSPTKPLIDSNQLTQGDNNTTSMPCCMQT